MHECTIDQPGDLVEYAFCPCSECLCAGVCVCAGHPEAARPDVQESGLYGVMSGSFADSADFEQCTQVSPANELSIQRAHTENSAYSFNQYLGSRSFYACAGVRPKNLIQNANQH